MSQYDSSVELRDRTVESKQHKYFLVEQADTVVDPRAVVIHEDDTFPARPTMVHVRRLH